MEGIATPRSRQDLPAWPSDPKKYPVCPPKPQAQASPTAKARRSDAAVQKMTRRNISNNSIVADLVLEDALPGIHQSDWAPSCSTPPNHARASSSSSKHKSFETSRPSNRRSRSFHDQAFAARPTTSQSRYRTRTLDDGQRYPSPVLPRVGSQKEMGNMPEHDPITDPTPIGYPSTVRYTYGGPGEVAEYQEPPKEKPKKAKSRQHSVSQKSQLTIPQSVPRTLQPPRSRTKCLQHLMTVTQGRMHGVVYYRRKSSSRWHTSYCAIDPISARLVKETSKQGQTEGTLIANLRGCRARCVREETTGLLLLELHTRDSPLSLQLRAFDEACTYKWQAAMLCWQPASGQEVIGPVPDCYSLVPLSLKVAPELAATQRISLSGRQPSIQKVGRLSLWHDDLESSSVNDKHTDDYDRSRWRSVSCTIKDNGDFVITGDDRRIITTVNLAKLSRSAIQRPHQSAYSREHCLSIVPQHSRLSWNTRRLRPVVLACPSREVYEAWYVLLRAFSVVELYGPSNGLPLDILRSKEMLPGLGPDPKSPSQCRVERFLRLQIETFEDKRSHAGHLLEPGHVHLRTQSSQVEPYEYRVEIFIEGMIRAKTRAKPAVSEVLFYEDFEFISLPATACFISFRLVKHWRAVDSLHSHGSKQASISGKTQRGRGHEQEGQLVGEATISLVELSKPRSRGQCVVLHDHSGSPVGALCVKTDLERHIILTDKEYTHALSDLLHHLNNSLTIEVADRASTELMKLARILINVFQVSRKAVDWLMSLAEEEIDGIRKEGPAQREPQLFRGRLNSHESKESLGQNAYALPNERADVVRDIRGTATAKANLLFRGNTLLSKALDFYMQRVGKDYLEKTLGSKMRTIVEEDIDLEVDPARASATASLPYNAVRLLGTTNELWTLIYESVQDCPTELRAILRYIKACAEDRFGDILRNAPYSAVSGFIFLRFFCPAILNPPLFGLVEESLTPRSQRNCTLLAKCIQGLANQTSFGAKESFMEPMNVFVNEHKQQYRDFIDKLCAVPHGFSRISLQPSQTAAQTIFTRLPPLVQEGIPALPYLIDYSRAFAALIKLWVDHKPHTIPADNRELKRFHHECLRIHRISEECYARAERRNVIGRDFTQAWAIMMEEMENHPPEFLNEELPGAKSNGMHRQPEAQERTIDFAAEKSGRRFAGSNTGSSRQSSSPGPVPPDEGRTRSLRGQFRFRSRSRSRPPSRSQTMTMTTTADDFSGGSDDEGFTGQEAEPRRYKLQKERPDTAEKSKKRFWSRHGADKQGDNGRKTGLC